MLKLLFKRGDILAKKSYFCTSCRKKVDKVQQLLFVEESKRGFCSEDCIVDFFTPYMESFDRQELEFRHILGLPSSEVGAEIFQNRELFDQVLYEAEEVWYEKNEINEEFYTHILRTGQNNKQFYIIICSYFEGEPSFVFFKTVTSNTKLVDMYRQNRRLDEKVNLDSTVEDISSDEEQNLDEINLPAELVEDLELKKSECLAQLLERRVDTDIAIDDYPKYDQFLSLTLEDADEEYTSSDESGDTVITFIKSFHMNGKSFFYIATCISLELQNVSETVMIPILSFPSVDNNLYKYYAVGEKKNSKLKN